MMVQTNVSQLIKCVTLSLTARITMMRLTVVSAIGVGMFLLRFYILARVGRIFL